MAPVLGYWALRGRTEPIRTLLAYTGTEHVEKLFEIGPPPTYDIQEWLEVKAKLDVVPPNLPYWIDGTIKMSESGAIMRYLARKNGLDGRTEEEKIRIDVAEGVIFDLTIKLGEVAYDPEALEKVKPFIADIDTPLKKCCEILGRGPYIAGEQISFADFLLLEQLERYEMIAPGSVAKFPSLEDFMKKITSIPSIAQYRQGPVFQKIKTRFFGRMATIGAGLESFE